MTDKMKQEIEQKRQEKLAKYKKEWWVKDAKKYNRFILNFNKEDNALLEQKAKELNKPKSLVAKEIIISSLKNNKINIDSKEDIEKRHKLVQDVISAVNGIGNNVNQIAKIVNERRLFSTNYNLTKKERNKMLDICQELEDILLDLVNKRDSL